ncbi:hypothetical protein GW17_00061199 [Ensete ventricosum]|nr:hypothetical protein GW17_00061199 [Ensete ventricosum]
MLQGWRLLPSTSRETLFNGLIGMSTPMEVSLGSDSRKDYLIASDQWISATSMDNWRRFVEDEDNEPYEESLELEDEATEEEPQSTDYVVHVWDTWRINYNLDLMHGSDLQIRAQCDPQFYKAQRNRETTFLTLEFRAGGAGDEGGLDLSQETFFCSGVY